MARSCASSGKGSEICTTSQSTVEGRAGALDFTDITLNYFVFHSPRCRHRLLNVTNIVVVANSILLGTRGRFLFSYHYCRRDFDKVRGWELAQCSHLTVYDLKTLRKLAFGQLQLCRKCGCEDHIVASSPSRHGEKDDWLARPDSRIAE